MNKNPLSEIIAIIEQELKRGKKKHPSYPDHIVARAAIVSEEAGELTRACLQFKYETANSKDGERVQIQAMFTEAVHTAATALRFLEALHKEHYLIKTPPAEIKTQPTLFEQAIASAVPEE